MRFTTCWGHDGLGQSWLPSEEGLRALLRGAVYSPHIRRNCRFAFGIGTGYKYFPLLLLLVALVYLSTKCEKILFAVTMAEQGVLALAYVYLFSSDLVLHGSPRQTACHLQTEKPAASKRIRENRGSEIEKALRCESKSTLRASFKASVSAPSSTAPPSSMV